MIKVNMQGKLIHVPESGDSAALKSAAITTVCLPSQKPVPLKMNVKSEPGTESLNQAITSIDNKPNILKLLNKYGNSTSLKGEVFKTIGNRIVIPMKVSVSTKKLAAIKSNNFQAKTCQSSTFQMTLSSNQCQKKPSNMVVKKNTKAFVPITLQRRKNLLQPPTNVHSKSVLNSAAECQTNSDLPLSLSVSNFMTSMSGTLYSSPHNSDQDTSSVVSSTDSSKFGLSMNGSKFSDFDQLLDEDDDLTSLTWLCGFNKELNNAIRKCNPDDPGIGMSGDEVESDNLASGKSIFLASSPVVKQNSSSYQPPSDEKYNPMGKPPYSFSCLIFMAIEDSYLKRLPVKDIYSWVCKHFPYFETAPSGWKNSIRHNLSLNRCFKKAESRKDSTKGSLWCIDTAYRPNLVQALKRSPYYPYLYPTETKQPLSLSSLGHLLPGTLSGRVPTWSPTLSSTTLLADADMTSAALNLMELRSNENTSSKSSESISHTLEEILRDAKWMVDQEAAVAEQSESRESNARELVVTRGSDQDHCYSALPPSKKMKKEGSRCCTPDSEKSAPDAAYEFETGGFTDDELDDVEMVQDIMNEIVIDEEDKDADQSLIDSGFGSMKDYVVKTEKKVKRKKGKVVLAEKQKSSKKRASKSMSDIPAKKPRRCKKKLIKLPAKPRGSKRHCDLESNSSSSSLVAKPKTNVNNKNSISDVDSGKDSPKVKRSSRNRRFQQRSYRKENISYYHTRSSGHRLVGQDSKNDVISSSRRKRLVSSHGETTDEEEEIKRAAGSLLRLAGLLKSPINLSRAPIK